MSAAFKKTPAKRTAHAARNAHQPRRERALRLLRMSDTSLATLGFSATFRTVNTILLLVCISLQHMCRFCVVTAADTTAAPHSKNTSDHDIFISIAENKYAHSNIYIVLNIALLCVYL